MALLAELNTKVRVSDLYQQNFIAVASWDDFVADKKTFSQQYFLAQQEAFIRGQLAHQISAELDKITWADHIIFQFPLWWFSTPAILKGWLDRVLVKGFAYDAGKTFDQGLLQGKTASLVVSTQSSESAYQLDGLHKETIDTFLHPIHHTLRFAGFKTLPPFVTYGAFHLESPQEEQIVRDYREYLKKFVL